MLIITKSTESDDPHNGSLRLLSSCGEKKLFRAVGETQNGCTSCSASSLANARALRFVSYETGRTLRASARASVCSNHQTLKPPQTAVASASNRLLSEAADETSSSATSEPAASGLSTMRFHCCSNWSLSDYMNNLSHRQLCAPGWEAAATA
jgi:hypothetical protein